MSSVIREGRLGFSLSASKRKQTHLLESRGYYLPANILHFRNFIKYTAKMVRLHVKKLSENLFLYDTSVETKVDDIIEEITIIHNGRLKVSRLCYGIIIFLLLTFQFNAYIDKF